MNTEPETSTPEIKPKRGLSILLILFVGLAVGLGSGLGLGRIAARHASASAKPEPAPKTMYQCPMHPQILQDHPGDCPICGMALVVMDGSPAESGSPNDTAQGDTALGDHVTITIDPERQQLIGLRTETVREGNVGGEIRTTGRLAVDETRVRRVNIKVEGFVEKLFVDFMGKPVTKGAPLFSLYSPEFVSAQREYLLALKTQKALSSGSLQTSGSDLLESARRRLLLWDVPREAIERLESTGEVQRAMVLRSPISGIVTAKNISEGARITPLDAPYEITDLSRVWVLADIYETELSGMKIGAGAKLSLQAFPGKTYAGRIAFIDPVMDPKTRTVRVRIEVPNPGGELKPEMFGEVLIQGPSHRGLLVPQDAVLDAGATKVVFVALGKGTFEPREVTVGAGVGTRVGTGMDERVEIRSGVAAGENIVTRATFLVDSESRLRSALAQMASRPKATEAKP